MILITHSLEDVLKDVSAKLNIKAKRLFTSKGGEIDDIKLIRDDDILYVTSGEPFIPVIENNNERLISYSDQTYFPSYPTSTTTASLLSSPVSSSSNFTLPSSSHCDWVLLNVGGKLFSTTRNTLTTKEPHSMLARMFSNESSHILQPSSQDSNGAYLIDRSPTYFEPILGYLRHGQLIMDKNINTQGVLEEAKFYGISSLIPILESMVASEEAPSVDVNTIPLTRRDIIFAIISTSFSSELRRE